MKIDSNGARLEVTDTQDGDTALVFLHHWGGSGATWSAVVERLEHRFRCVTIDARGAGASSAPATGYGTQDHAADALAVVRALGLRRFVLVGHSMGGKAAQVLAAGRPEGLLGVALVASSPPSPMAIDEAQRAQMRLAYADEASVAWSLDNVLLGSPVSDDVRRQLVADALRIAPQARAGWIDVGTREDFGSATREIAVPLAIVAGELDRVDPRAVVESRIAAHYPSAPVTFLAGKGHLLPVEAADEVAEIVGGFAAALR